MSAANGGAHCDAVPGFALRSSTRATQLTPRYAAQPGLRSSTRATQLRSLLRLIARCFGTRTQPSTLAHTAGRELQSTIRRLTIDGEPVNPAQEAALGRLDASRETFFHEYPNQWIAVNANGTIRAAERFDLLARQPGVDPESFVFAFVRVGARA